MNIYAYTLLLEDHTITAQASCIDGLDLGSFHHEKKITYIIIIIYYNIQITMDDHISHMEK